jgi:hypothetical protein
VISHLIDNTPALRIKDCSESIVEAKLSMLLPDEVNHREMALSARAPETPPKLLREDGRRRSRP